MRSVIALSGALSFLLIGEAFADSPAASYLDSTPAPGLSPELGLVRPATDELKPDELTNGAFGYAFSNGFRAEVERLGFGSAIPGVTDSPIGGIRTTTLMLSGMYEFSNGSWRLKPYVGIGIGTTDFSSRLLGNTETSFIPSFQVKGGVNYNISQKLLGKLEYRWSQGNAPSLGIAGLPAKFQLKRGGFLVGLNYRLQ